MSGWTEASLGEVCELYQPKTISSSELVEDGPFPVYGANGVIGRYDKFNHEDSQLLITCRGATCGAVNISQPNSWINGNAMVVKPRNKSIDVGFLKHLFLGGIDLSAVITGAAQPQITRQSLAPLKIRFPNPAEQQRLISILDQADALRAKRREALAQLDSLTQSIFIEMFGDPRSNERKWRTAAIGSLISEMRGGAPLEPDDFTDSGFPILHKGAIKPLGRIQVDAKKKTFASFEYAASKPNCIADRRCVAVTLRDLVPSGPSIGLAADLRYGAFDQYLLAQGAYAFHLDPQKVTSEYFVHLSNMPTFRYVFLQNAVGSTQIHIRTPIYLAIKPPVPPIELQKEFSKRVRVIDAMKMQHSSSLSELDRLFASLQHRAFQGEL